MNFTITVPEGTTNRGNPRLLCFPAQWHDYAVFFLTNYVAHAATTVPTPGRSTRRTMLAMLFALLLPGFAITRAVNVILRRAALEKDPLKSAARAGALCIVLKKGGRDCFNDNEGDVEGCGTSSQHLQAKSSASCLPNTGLIGMNWLIEMEEPRTEDGQISNHEIRGGKEKRQQPISSNPKPSLIKFSDFREGYRPVLEANIHGQYWLHEDYYLATLPPTPLPNLKLKLGQKPIAAESRSSLEQSNTVLPCNQNFLKLFASLAQSVWATATIYRARGDQIEQYGYAAFCLTVAPYATMSIINTIANMLTRDYPAIFVLRTPLLRQLENEQKAFFNGALDITVDSTSQDGFEKRKDWPSRLGAWLDEKFFSAPGHALAEFHFPIEYSIPTMGLSYLLSLIPLAIVGGLSGFQQGSSSTQTQRGFTMSWLITGIVYGHMCGIIFDLLIIVYCWKRGLKPNKPEEKPLRADPRWFAWPQLLPVGNKLAKIYILMVALAFGTPVLGGMVVVVKMIGEFGVCTRFKD